METLWVTHSIKCRAFDPHPIDDRQANLADPDGGVAPILNIAEYFRLSR